MMVAVAVMAMTVAINGTAVTALTHEWQQKERRQGSCSSDGGDGSAL
jgi:hypothetical protein